MALMQFYCPRCFAEVEETEAPCPRCGAAASEWTAAHSLQERLVHALSHPLREVRMMAIITLGNRGDPRSAAPLARCAFDHPTDLVQGLEILRSIAKLPRSKERTQALHRLSRHPAHAIRAEAERLLGDGEPISRHRLPPLTP
jgi:hypothetical protein